MIEENNTINISILSDNYLTGHISSSSGLNTNVEGKGDTGPMGPPGSDGITYIPEIKSVVTLSPNENAFVSVEIKDHKMLFSFGIPKGSPGEGDMLKSIYDSNNDNIIDNAENAKTAETADSATLLGKLSEQNILDSIKELNNKFKDYVKYELVTKGEWTYKKYEDGTIKMWHRHVGEYSFQDDYGGSTYWTGSGNFAYPVPLKEVFSRHADVFAYSHLINCNFSAAFPELTEYCLFLYDIGQRSTNQNITIYVEINGRWK